MLRGPLATQHGAFAGYAGAGPTMGNTFWLASTMAKLSGLWAGVNPRVLPQNASPSGVLSASAGRAMVAPVPLSGPPSCVSGSCRTDPDFSVTAAQVLPTAICAAELSDRLTTLPSR